MVDAGDCVKKNVYEDVSFRFGNFTLYLCKWQLNYLDQLEDWVACCEFEGASSSLSFRGRHVFLFSLSFSN